MYAPGWRAARRRQWLRKHAGELMLFIVAMLATGVVFTGWQL